MKRIDIRPLLVGFTVLLAATTARSDPVTDWNAKLIEIMTVTPGSALPKVRAVAVAQCAVFEAVTAITGRLRPMHLKLDREPDASIDAAVAAATQAAVSKLLPAAQSAMASAYQAGVAQIPDSPAKARGIALGERAAAQMLALRADDGAALPDNYRPKAKPGLYVPTPPTVAPRWGERKPWALARGDQLRPAPPPALNSAIWARDFNEVKALGASVGSRRTAEQTDIARFWETTGVAVYFPLVQSVALAPGREVTQNARLMAAVAMAMDDAYIAVFDAKYAYDFWRPVTAIRNADIDGNDATALDATWESFISTPMHPEYPCAHCIQAGAVGTVLAAEIGSGPVPPLSSVSATAQGMVRRWSTIEDFVAEVQLARIYDGVHYRNSAEVGTAMGRRIGEMVASRWLR